MKIVSLEEKYRQPVTDRLNYYIVNGWAAFPENPVPTGIFDMLLELAKGYPAIALLEEDESFIGFGTQMLQYFETEARPRGITTFIASICDKNEASIEFHKRMGFTEQGHLPNIGIRRGQSFGIVYMQQEIGNPCAKP